MASAEQAYLFRHALLRDAAYQLQMPGDRGRLHGLALSAIETIHGGPPPGPDAIDGTPFKQHHTDVIAAELANHARQASAFAGIDMVSRERLYLWRAAKFSELTYDSTSASQHWESLAALIDGSASGEALGFAGQHAVETGRFARAEDLFARSLACSRQYGDRRLERQALGSLARVHGNTGRFADAERLYLQVIRLAHEDGDALTEGKALANLTGIQSRTDRPKLQEQNLLKALALVRSAAADHKAEATILGILAVLYFEDGRVELAERTFANVLAIARAHGLRHAEGLALGNQACVQQSRGHQQQAAESHETAKNILRETGNLWGLGAHLCDFATSRLSPECYLHASSVWKQGEELLRQFAGTATREAKRRAMLDACEKAGVPPLCGEAP